jgi:hypothetical protein
MYLVAILMMNMCGCNMQLTWTKYVVVFEWISYTAWLFKNTTGKNRLKFTIILEISYASSVLPNNLLGITHERIHIRVFGVLFNNNVNW